MKILILYAFDSEVSQLQHRLVLEEKQIQGCICMHGQLDDADIHIAKTGIGTTRAAVVTTRLLLALKPDIIIYMGTAGGLKAGTHIGDIFVGKKIVDTDLLHVTDVLKDTPFASCLFEAQHDMSLQFIYQPDETWLTYLLSLDFPRISPGVIATSSIFPAPKDALDAMKSVGSDVIEMEGSGACYAAFLEHIPLVVIRAISNHLDAQGNDLGTTGDALDICATRLADFMMVILANAATFKRNQVILSS